MQSTAVLKIDKLDNDMKCTEISRQYPAGTASVEVVSGTSASNSPLTATGGDSVMDSTGIASCTLQLSANYKQDEWKHMVLARRMIIRAGWGFILRLVLWILQWLL